MRRYISSLIVSGAMAVFALAIVSLGSPLPAQQGKQAEQQLTSVLPQGDWMLKGINGKPPSMKGITLTVGKDNSFWFSHQFPPGSEREGKFTGIGLSGTYTVSAQTEIADSGVINVHFTLTLSTNPTILLPSIPVRFMLIGDTLQLAIPSQPGEGGKYVAPSNFAGGKNVTVLTLIKAVGGPSTSPK